MVDDAQQARPHVIDGRLVKIIGDKNYTAPAPSLGFPNRDRRYIAVTTKLSFGDCFAVPDHQFRKCDHFLSYKINFSHFYFLTTNFSLAELLSQSVPYLEMTSIDQKLGLQ